MVASGHIATCYLLRMTLSTSTAGKPGRGGVYVYQKCSFPSNSGSPNGISVGLSVFAGLMSVTNTQTGRQTYRQTTELTEQRMCYAAHSDVA